MLCHLGILLLAPVTLAPGAGTRTDQQPVRCVGHRAIVTAVALSPDGKLVASGSDDQTLRVWGARAGNPLRILRDGVWVGGVRFSPDGKVLATTGADGVRFWDAHTGKQVRDGLPVRHPGHGLTFAGNAPRLAVADRFGIQVWNWQTGKRVRQISLEGQKGFGRAWQVALSADGTLLAAALHGSGGERLEQYPAVRVWEVETGSEVFKAWPGATAHAVAFSPDGRYLAAGGMVRDGADNIGVLEVWDRRDGSVLFRVRADKHGLFCLAFRPDGKIIATGGTDPTISMWNAATGALVGKLEGHTDQVHDLSFSADGKTLASAGRDHKVLVWRLDAAGRPRSLLEGTWLPHKIDRPLPGMRFKLDYYRGEFVASYARLVGGKMIDVVTYKADVTVKQEGEKLRLIPRDKESRVSPVVCRLEGDRLVIEAGTVGDKIPLRGEWRRAPEENRLP